MDACGAQQAQPHTALLRAQEAAEDEEWRWRTGAGPPSASHHGAAPAAVRGVFIIASKTACKERQLASGALYPGLALACMMHAPSACHEEGCDMGN